MTVTNSLTFRVDGEVLYGDNLNSDNGLINWLIHLLPSYCKSKPQTLHIITPLLKQSMI